MQLLSANSLQNSPFDIYGVKSLPNRSIKHSTTSRPHSDTYNALQSVTYILIIHSECTTEDVLRLRNCTPPFNGLAILNFYLLELTRTFTETQKQFLPDFLPDATCEK